MTQPETPQTPLWLLGQERMRLKRRVGIAAVGVLVVVGLMLGLPMVISPEHSVVIPSMSASPTVGPNASSTLLRGQVMVHVAGAVLRPGLVIVSTGDRVVDAILRAGGLSTNADRCAINLARVVNDGEQIIVPIVIGAQSSCLTGNSTASGSSVRPGTAKVSLSRATIEQLDALPGVGPALAQRIIDWRSAHGGFQSVAQLDEVSGIGTKLLNTLTPLLTP